MTVDAPLEEGKIMEMTTVQSVSVRSTLETLSKMLADTLIEFDPRGMKIMATDPLRQVLVHMFLDGSRFEHYYCPGKVFAGVNMIQFAKLVKSVTNNNTLTFSMDANDMNHLYIKIENFEKNQRTNFKMRLLDLPQDKLSARPLLFNSLVTMPSADFQKIVRDMAQLGVEHVELKDVQNQLIFSCAGDFGSQETILCERETNQHVKKDPTEILQGVFSLKLLSTFTNCTNLSNTVEIMLKNDYPLILRYGVASLGEIKLCLTPVVQKDVDEEDDAHPEDEEDEDDETAEAAA